MSTVLVARRSVHATNVGDVERVGSALAGAALLLSGLGRRSLAGRGAAALGSALVVRGVTGRCPVYAWAGRQPQAYRHPVRVTEAMQVSVPPEQAYAAWRDLERLPRFMKHVKAVRESGPLSRWTVQFSGLAPISWDAEIVRDVPGKVISWRSRPEAVLENAGSVTFFDLGPRGTGLRVEIGYYPPAGPLGGAVARLFSPLTEQQVREDVRRFKQLLEAGEIPTTEGQPRGVAEKAGAR